MGRKKIIEMHNLRAHIYLIRHGETEWSLSGRHTSHTDISLTGRGEDGARELGQRLRNIQFAHVLLSPIIAGAALSLSSVSVITNALRLRKVKL
jgi:bisphosphoglycerate-dependent phosphoglycerate mutase